ncbi:MAG TPA: D-alanyl-D-alanine carboxypeptidase [Streptosporangiaceae bacterium]|nr:D-alanyl-D-alanine carboxypeptidase [Streptosporangiaceae bacterium]
MRRGALGVPALVALVAAVLPGFAASTPAESAVTVGKPRPTHQEADGVRARRAETVARPMRSAPELGSYAASIVGGPLMASTGTVVNEPANGAAPVPNVPASAWVIANAGTGQVLAAKDPHGEYGPASTLKVLTAVTLIPLLNPNAEIVATPLATAQQPTSAYLVTGQYYKVADLFRALLMISANDAAMALTQATGSFAKGMALINAEARHLQAYDVVAKLPNGLPAAGQVVSAYDEALIARQALSMPAFMRYDQTLTSSLELKPNDWETLVNQNYLLTQYPGGIGGKIGWTVSSEATYIGLARRNGVTLIVTVLHCTSLQEITSAEQLLNWGFAMNGKVKPVGTLVPPLASEPRHPQTGRRGPGSAAAAAALTTPEPGPGGSYALAIGGLAVAVLGLGSLVVTRRRAAAGRRGRPAAGGGPPDS